MTKNNFLIKFRDQLLLILSNYLFNFKDKIILVPKLYKNLFFISKL